MTTITRQLRLRASTSPLTSNTDKHLMVKAAEQIEDLQRLLNACKQQKQEQLQRFAQSAKDHDHDSSVAPWETR